MKRFNKKNGFTLFELVIAAALISVIALVVSVMIVRGFQSYRSGKDIITIQESAAGSMRDFEKTARGATEVLVASSNQFAFFTFLVGDNYPAPSQVRFFFDNGYLMEGIIAPVGTGPTFTYPAGNEITKSVGKYIINGSLIFSYYNDASVLISQPVPTDAVKMVRITVTVDNDINKKPDSITESTVVSLRNLKTNL